MKNKPIIGVDVDLTIVRTDLAWIEYVGNVLFPNNPGEAFAKIDLWKKANGSVPYNIAEVFSDELQSLSEGQQDLYEFWRSETLYNLLEPIEGSVKALRSLSEDHEIVFCTRIKGNHHKSKFYFLDKWFPFHSGVILTHEKHQACGGWLALVDDRIDTLNKCLEKHDNLLAIQYSTSYTQSQPPNWEIRNWGSDWRVIERMIRVEEKLR